MQGTGRRSFPPSPPVPFCLLGQVTTPTLTLPHQGGGNRGDPQIFPLPSWEGIGGGG